MVGPFAAAVVGFGVSVLLGCEVGTASDEAFGFEVAPPGTAGGSVVVVSFCATDEGFAVPAAVLVATTGAEVGVVQFFVQFALAADVGTVVGVAVLVTPDGAVLPVLLFVVEFAVGVTVTGIGAVALAGVLPLLEFEPSGIDDGTAGFCDDGSAGFCVVRISPVLSVSMTKVVPTTVVIVSCSAFWLDCCLSCTIYCRN